MIMFIVGFIACWILLATLAIISDDNDGGISLFGGWDSILLTLPVYAIIKLIVKILEAKRNSKK